MEVAKKAAGWTVMTSEVPNELSPTPFWSQMESTGRKPKAAR